MVIDYKHLSRLSQVWPITSQKFPNIVALHSPHSNPEIKLTFKELWEKMQYFASGLQSLGLKKDEKVSIFADNSPRWLVSEQAVMLAGGVNVVRSAVADTQELLYIFQDSDSVALIVEDLKTWQKIQPKLEQKQLKFVILLSDETTPENFLNYEQVLKIGAERTLVENEEVNIDSLATLIYTSGTSGQPKGVMLTHRNLLHQINSLGVIITPNPGDIVLSILPCWHSYERSGEYYLLSQGCTQIYTNIRYFKNDLKDYHPHLMVGVPRIWESIYEGVQKQFQQYPTKKQNFIYNLLGLSEKYVLKRRIVKKLALENLKPSLVKRFLAAIQTIYLFPCHLIAERLIYRSIRKNLGGNFKTLVSGGGALAKHLDTFFEAIGVDLLVGYGLTETSPVVTARTVKRNLRGSSGQAIPQTQIKIVHPETRENIPFGQTGIVLVRGPQVMQGYYKKAEATSKVIDSDGWFDTGDLGWISNENDLVLTGRAKDTIVLTNGENIEPEPIENACIRSPYIEQIILVGQDQKSLGAIIVPNLEILQKWNLENKLNLKFPEKSADFTQIKASSLYDKRVLEKLRQELSEQIKNRPGYRTDDQIKTFELILEPFSLDNSMMTQTLKIKRSVVMERYHDIIDEMFEK
jgi:long-chain acyl-CoA synthetase